MNLFRIFALLVLLALPGAYAQGLYLGVSLATPLDNQISDFTEAAELGAQLGFDFIPFFGVRAGIEGNPFSGGLKLATVDLIGKTYVPLTYHNFYGGIGADGFFLTEPSSLEELQSVNLSAHVLVGGEFRPSGKSGVGIFVEALPSYLIGDDLASLSDPNAYYLRARAGINYHF